MAGSDIELCELEAQPVAVLIIVNLCGGPLEKLALDIISEGRRDANPFPGLISVTDPSTNLVVG